MKAKEYAERYRNNRTKEELINILDCFVKEFFELNEKRKPKSNDAILALFKETNNKWKAFAKEFEEVPLYAFVKFVIKFMPEIVPFWDEAIKYLRSTSKSD